MKKFKFRLETVRTIRHLKKEKWMAELSKAIKTRWEKEAEVENKKMEMIDLNDEIILARKHNFSSTNQAQYLSQFNELYLEKAQMESQLNECIVYERQVKNSLNEATRDSKIIDNLSEKEKKTYLDKLFKQEEKELEDLMNSRNERYNLKAI